MEVFKRYEKKYLLSKKQYDSILKKLDKYIVPDKYPLTNIRSIYYDNDQYELIRRSIEKPEYKEKLRIRSYKNIQNNAEVFVELKKKLDGTVYKRRTTTNYKQALNNINECTYKDKQVGEEIKYFIDYYEGLKPKIYIGTDRKSYVVKDDESIRITFDSNIKYRLEDLKLKDSKKYDKSLTDQIVMEIKVNNSLPLWLCDILSDVKAYPRGYSKVGNAYLKEIEKEK